MKISNMILDSKQFGATYLLVGITPAYQYVSGQRTDQVAGYRYTIALPEVGYDRVEVRIDGPQRIEMPEKPAEVTIAGFEAYVSWRGGDYVVAARATGIALTNKDKPKA